MINVLALSVPAAFLLDSTVRNLIFLRFDIYSYLERDCLILIIIILAMIIYVFSSVIYFVYNRLVQNPLLAVVNKIKISLVFLNKGVTI